MPRDLADVLHYFLPELEESAPSAPVASPNDDVRGAGGERDAPEARESDTPPPLPILGLPLADRDVVRAALAWNLAVETSRLGATSVLLTPEIDRESALWPEAGVGPLGCELLYCPAKDLASLYETASDLARRRAIDARHGGTIFVRIPPAWLVSATEIPASLRWVLLLSTSGKRDLEETYEIARALYERECSIEIGLTVHGVSTISEARAAFESMLRRSQSDFDQQLISYGLLVDDLHVYRAIAAQRPIGLAHPQAPATKALMDVARLVYEDTRSRVLG